MTFRSLPGLWTAILAHGAFALTCSGASAQTSSTAEPSITRAELIAACLAADNGDSAARRNCEGPIGAELDRLFVVPVPAASCLNPPRLTRRQAIRKLAAHIELQPLEAPTGPEAQDITIIRAILALFPCGYNAR